MIGARYLDPEVLARLPNMELRARRLVEGLFVGYHKSPQFGYSVEFADHREYVHGDDLRTVDWRVWARKNRYYVKRFEMESQLKTTLILDVSRSMDFGRGRLTKLQYGCYLAATLAYLLIGQNDMAGLVTFDESIRTYLPPRGSRAHLRTILHTLDGITAGPATRAARVCHDLAETIRARGMVVLISDLLDGDDAEVIAALRHFQHRKHDVIVFHILDDAELELPYREVANFVDVEAGGRVAVDPGAFRAEYCRRVEAFCANLSRECSKTRIDYRRVTPATPLPQVLGEFIRFRRRRSR